MGIVEWRQYTGIAVLFERILGWTLANHILSELFVIDSHFSNRRYVDLPHGQKFF